MSSSSKTSGSTATQNAPTTKPQAAQSGHSALPHDKIAMRAFTKWQQRGCPCGTDMQDWQEAETELKAELARGNSAPAAAAKPAQQRR